MGGTSSDICLIRNGRPGWTVDASVGGFPIRLPMMDIHTRRWAGGGSVIWVDSGGGLRVGPQSAGSRPGPACYGFGGNLPTITDAHMEIGTLRPEFFEGKDIPVRPEAGTKALAALGEPLGMSAGEVAADALRVVNFHLAKEIRAATLARGFEALGVRPHSLRRGGPASCLRGGQGAFNRSHTPAGGRGRPVRSGSRYRGLPVRLFPCLHSSGRQSARK